LYKFFIGLMIGTSIVIHISIYLYTFSTIMKQISGLSELQQELQTNRRVWLLLIKKGSDQSACAWKNFLDSVVQIENQLFLFADVNEVRDIHPAFGIQSVPSLLEFNNGVLANVVKGCHQASQFSAIFENSVVATGSAEPDKPAKNVTVYTTPTCSWCSTLKRHLDVHKIRYREIDVSKDQKAAEVMVRRSGQQGVPQTEINGQMIVGFDRERINRLLEIKQ
jgi:glutaredoxin-like YruB-family protein